MLLTPDSGHVCTQHEPECMDECICEYANDRLDTQLTSIAKITAKIPNIGQNMKESTARGMFKMDGAVGIDSRLPSSSTHWYLYL